MVSGAIDWNICPEVLGMTKDSIPKVLLHEADGDGLVQYNLWSFPGPQGKYSSLLHPQPLNN
jgi:hypothetical protein